MNYSGFPYKLSYSDTNIKSSGERTGYKSVQEQSLVFGGSDFCYKHMALQLKAVSSNTSLPTVAVRRSLNQVIIPPGAMASVWAPRGSSLC